MHLITRYRRRAIPCAAVGIAMALACVPGSAQPAEPANGPRHVDPSWHALVNATVVTEPGEVLEGATVIVREGVIDSVDASGGPAPAGARAWDCTGLTIYPGLIDPYVPVTVADPKERAEGRHWNDKVRAERTALDSGGLDEAARKALRTKGFAVAQLAPDSGIFRGSTAIVTLGDDDSPGRALPRTLRGRVFDVLTLAGGGFGGGYPSSKMGAIALIRQTLSDAAWYGRAWAEHESVPSKNHRPARNDSFAALGEGRPMLFEVSNELDALRASRLAEEFGRSLVLRGSGAEYRRLGPIVEIAAPMIVPVTMAKAPSVGTPGERDAVSLSDMMAWEQSPTNLRRLEDAGAFVALTTSGLRTKAGKEDFWKNVRRAIEAGLDEEAALAMLTTRGAEILGIDDRAGRIESGMAANLVVCKGELFDKDREIRDVWIDGRRYEIKSAEDDSHEGTWTVHDGIGTLKIKGSGVSFTRPVDDADEHADADDDERADADDDDADDSDDAPEDQTFKGRSFKRVENRLSWVMDGEVADLDEGVVLVSATVEGDRMIGVVELPDGGHVDWTARRADDEDADDEDDADADEPGDDGDDAEDAHGDEEDSDSDIPETLVYPFGAFGTPDIPEQQTIVVTNATIWTCADGDPRIIEGGTLLVRDGRIEAVLDAGAPVPGAFDGARVIDATGKHVSPGLIDCHSHTGISGGVNEGTQAVTAEVRIGDVVNPDSVSWYRELAGGLTCVNQLHGSANPIGGQNSVVKIRWGVHDPEEMKLDGAPGGIKFALGENVKQSNWGDSATTRYPQTRMGVESIMRDRFVAAREYMIERGWRHDESSGRWIQAGSVPETSRRDLELEALGEIIRGERLVHCHSYRQDEILMLCRLASEFGFRIGTFQHVLEGYKVAEAIRDNAIGGSSFSDWWAYKFEVYDAIPYNGSIMHDVGVVVSFNSDSDELARRMNTEAAKAVKYGGVAPGEALQFVTLNPAKQLRIDSRVGSLEAGKDADFVIWSGSPLSSLSRCEATFIDGREYFSLEKDRRLREEAEHERLRLIQKLLAKKGSSGAKEKGQGKGGGRGRGRPVPTRAELEAAMAYEYMLLNGLNPFEMRCGECGCATHNILQESR